MIFRLLLQITVSLERSGKIVIFIVNTADCRAAKRFLKTHSIMNNYHKVLIFSYPSKLDLASILGSYIQQLSQRAWLRLWSGLLCFLMKFHVFFVIILIFLLFVVAMLQVWL